MKLKIYQQGGGLTYTPFIPEQYADSSGRSSRSSSGSDDEDAKLDPLDKELLGLMKDQNLLPSDIQMIYNRLIAFQRSTQRLSSTSGFGGTGSYRSVMPGMLQIMNLVSQARYNKARADSAISQMTKESTGSDVALDKYGRMYVQNVDNGKVEKVLPKDYDTEKYRPISNSELMYLREQSLPFDSEILSDVVDTVGMSSISKEINRIIDAFGTTKSEGYFDKNSSEIFSALASKSPNGIYKITEEKTNADLRKAWNIIYKQLPTNMRQVLDARAALTGSNPVDFIHEIVLSNIDYKQGIDYDATQSKAAGFDTDPLKTKQDKEQLTQNNYLMQIGTLQGLPTRVDIYPRASKISEKGSLNAAAYSFGRVIDRKNNPIGKMSVAEMTKEGWAFAAGVPGSVTYGNKLLKDYELEALLFDDQSNLTAVLLPYKNEGGHIVPDFELFDKYNKLQKAIKGKNLSQMEINSIASNLGLDPNKYKIKNGIVEISDTMAFLTVSAYAGDETLDLTKDETKYLEKIDKQDGQHIKDLYNNMVKYGQLRPAKKGNVEISGYSKSGKRDFWKGNVFMPIENAYYSLLLSGIGEFVPKSDITDYLERVIARERYNEATQYIQQNDPNYNVNKNIGQFNDE